VELGAAVGFLVSVALLRLAAARARMSVTAVSQGRGLVGTLLLALVAVIFLLGLVTASFWAILLVASGPR
jgi:hypothetical protein